LEESRVLEGANVRRYVWIVTAIALLYSGAHFLQSGILFPLHQENIAKFEEETPALREHIRTGEPVHFGNPVQYGPVFFFVMHPLLVHATDTHQLSNALYAIQLPCIALALLLTLATLKPLARAEDWSLVAAWIVVVWLNFAPLYTILAVKSVETWELLLMSLALYGYMRGKLWLLAIAIASAALVKVLPLIFFYYLLLTNRRALMYACGALLAILLVSHLLYGPEMGIWYLPTVAKAASGHSFGLLWHENLSVKAAIAKMIGRLDAPDVAAGIGGSTLRMTDDQLRTAIVLGNIAVGAGFVWLTSVLVRRTERTRDRILWEWSLVTVAMLILSPNTTFEYATLALGALSYAIVELLRAPDDLTRRRRAWITLGAAMFFLGVLLPRRVLNQLTFALALSHWNGYYHLTASEAYQFYCFPLLGLFLLIAAIWQLQPRGRAAAIPVRP
jgi:Glycosyltransferase family 87